MVYRDHIEIDPKICSGKPVIRGTRILVTSILSQLAAKESFEKIRQGFPALRTKTSAPQSNIQSNPSDSQTSNCDVCATRGISEPPVLRESSLVIHESYLVHQKY